jgi:hypothetical protein
MKNRNPKTKTNPKSIAEASIDSPSLGGRELEGGGFYTGL